MQWSRAVLPKIVAETKVMEYTPQKIDLGSPKQALEYIERKHGSDFRMNESVQIHTGVDQIERVSDEERVEQRALEMLADIQQKAYQEAQALGLEDGRKQAFSEVSAMIAEKLDRLEELLGSMTRVKEEIRAQNEAHMIKLLYHMASRVAGVHLENHNEAIVEILRSAVSLAQDEENIRVELHPSQVEFIEEIRKQNGREFEFLKKIRFEPGLRIKPGGCVVETNYGEIDARIETRLEKLWETLKDAVPKVKDEISGQDGSD